jgi:ferredoxin-NADP reductase
MFATGSGISPIKALIESGSLGSRPDVRLYYGTRNEGERPRSKQPGAPQQPGPRSSPGPAAARSSTVRPAPAPDLPPSQHPTHTPAAATAYRALVPAWEAAGVKVIPVHSDAGHGYVQDAFAAAKNLAGGAGSVGAVLCGQKEMCNAVKELLAAEGVAPERVLLNF